MELTSDTKDINTRLINRNELDDVVKLDVDEPDQLETDRGQAILDNRSFQENT